jgi:hypothetical protein
MRFQQLDNGHVAPQRDKVPIEPGSFYVMDCGYLDFSRLYVLPQQGRFG